MSYGRGHVTGTKRERRPRRRTQTQLVRDIVDSIRCHRAHGIPRTPEQYTACPETIAHIQRLLGLLESGQLTDQWST